MINTKSIILTIILLSPGASAVEASGFADDFREFVLGDSELAATTITIDHVSQQCMACHNGSSGSHIQIKAASSPMQFSGFGSSNHPLGMQYANYAAQQPGDFRQPAALDPNIKLVDGRVGCLSCHKLTEKDKAQVALESRSTVATASSICKAPKLFTVGPRKTDLCLSCHKK